MPPDKQSESKGTLDEIETIIFPNGSEHTKTEKVSVKVVDPGTETHNWVKKTIHHSVPGHVCKDPWKLHEYRPFTEGYDGGLTDETKTPLCTEFFEINEALIEKKRKWRIPLIYNPETYLSITVMKIKDFLHALEIIVEFEDAGMIEGTIFGIKCEMTKDTGDYSILQEYLDEYPYLYDEALSINHKNDRIKEKNPYLPAPYGDELEIGSHLTIIHIIQIVVLIHVLMNRLKFHRPCLI